MVNADFARTRKCVDHYRKLGLCPLPSRMDVKGPMLAAYAEHYQGKPVPESVYEDWQTDNVQLITGVTSPTSTKILVVDCDGEQATGRWNDIVSHYHCVIDCSWLSLTGSGEGYHTYFTVPDGVESCPSGLIWGLWDTWGDDGKGRWAKHQEIRILADNSLVIAPPSRHVGTGNRYEFTGNQSPKRNHLPAPAPDWLLAMPRLSAPRFGEPARAPAPPNPYVRQSDHWYTREEVLAAMGGQKWDIATREWGLAPASAAPNLNGWCSCYVPGREDPRHSRPSGSFNFDDGTLQDRKDLSCISFFDLGVLLNRFATWQECRDAMGDRFIGKRRKESTYKYCF